MATWTHDVRPISLIDWGLHHQEVRPNAVIPEATNEVRPSCIIPTGDDIGEE